MTKFDSESGSVHVPTRAWAGVKRSVLEAALEHRDKVHGLAVTMQERLAVKLKGKRGLRQSDYQSAKNDILFSFNPTDEVENFVSRLVAKSRVEGSFNRFKKITQKHLDEVLGKKPNTTTKVFNLGEATISFGDKVVYWNVPENNHAVERAHEHPVSCALFEALNRVDYGKNRNMGGVIVGNDEYNRDNEDVGGGANYITHAYGPRGDERSRPRY